MATPPIVSTKAQAMEAGYDHVPRTASAGGAAGLGTTRGGKSTRCWRNSGKLLNSVLTIDDFDRLGLPRLT